MGLNDRDASTTWGSSLTLVSWESCLLSPNTSSLDVDTATSHGDVSGILSEVIL